MTDLAQNLLDPASRHADRPALRMDEAGKRLRRTVEVRQEVGTR